MSEFWEGTISASWMNANGARDCPSRSARTGLGVLYWCTRDAGHAGRHLAEALHGQVVAAWPGTHEPTAADLDDPTPSGVVIPVASLPTHDSDAAAREAAARPAAAFADVDHRHCDEVNRLLRAEVERLTRERDLAVAHDRQPYPTAAAYEKAVAALERHRKRAGTAEAERDAARAEVERLRDLLDDATSWEQGDAGADQITADLSRIRREAGLS